LKDKDSFRKFKAYQIDLTKIEGEIARLDEKLKSIDKISILNEATSQLTEKLEALAKSINTQITSSDNKIYPEIRRIFHNIFKYIFNASAIIFMKQNG
jgi:predicted nuclease with TOPRIM domain